MRGKKKDHEFIAAFIEMCVSRGMTTSDEFADHANSLISDLDEEIIILEEKKLLRSKLIDVVSSFGEKVNQKTKIFDIRYDISKYITEHLPTTLDSLTDFNKEDVIFVLKQMIEQNIIKKDNNKFDKSEKYEEFVVFLESICQIKKEN